MKGFSTGFCVALILQIIYFVVHFIFSSYTCLGFKSQNSLSLDFNYDNAIRKYFASLCIALDVGPATHKFRGLARLQLGLHHRNLLFFYRLHFRYYIFLILKKFHVYKNV